MNDTGIRPEVIEEIRNLAQKYDIEKVILFGSRARGDFRRTSDIDIAVTGGDFARFALDVDEETSTLLEYDIVNRHKLEYVEYLNDLLLMSDQEERTDTVKELLTDGTIARMQTRLDEQKKEVRCHVREQEIA